MNAVTLGELMLRLAPEGYLRFVQADKLGAAFGGGETNVAVAASCLKHSIVEITIWCP